MTGDGVNLTHLERHQRYRHYQIAIRLDLQLAEGRTLRVLISEPEVHQLIRDVEVSAYQQVVGIAVGKDKELDIPTEVIAVGVAAQREADPIGVATLASPGFII